MRITLAFSLCATMLVVGCAPPQSRIMLDALQQDCAAGYNDACAQVPAQQQQVAAEQQQNAAMVTNGMAGGALTALAILSVLHRH